MIKVLLDQYYRCLPGLRFSVNQSVHPEKCRANCFWDKNAEKCVTRGLREGGAGEGGGRYAFPFTALILYLRLRCRTLYINGNGFRPA